MYARLIGTRPDGSLIFRNCWSRHEATHVWIDGEFVPIEKTTMMHGWHVGPGAEPPRRLDVEAFSLDVDPANLGTNDDTNRTP